MSIYAHVMNHKRGISTFKFLLYFTLNLTRSCAAPLKASSGRLKSMLASLRHGLMIYTVNLYIYLYNI